MRTPLLNWLAVAIEIVGLALIALDCYLPETVNTARASLEKTLPRPLGGTPVQRESWRTTTWIALYAVAWVAIAAGFSAYDPAWGLVANVALAVITVLVLILTGVAALLVRVVRGPRGAERSLSSMGLITVLVGIALQVTQLLLA